MCVNVLSTAIFNISHFTIFNLDHIRMVENDLIVLGEKMSSLDIFKSFHMGHRISKQNILVKYLSKKFSATTNGSGSISINLTDVKVKVF